MIYTCKPERVAGFDNRELGLTAAQVKERTGCDIVFNGALFNADRSLCVAVKADGKWIALESYELEGFGWNRGGAPKWMTAREACEFDEFISCVDVTPEARRGRTAFGMTPWGIMKILCVADGTQAMTIPEVRQYLEERGCISILVLDGGLSSQMICPAGIISSTRNVPHYICVWMKKETEDKELKIIEETYRWAYGPTIRQRTTHLVLHHVGVVGAFSAQDIHRLHLQNGWRGIAYHFYVRKDGSIYRGREENVYGGHTTNYNNVALGICFEGNFEVETMTAAQIKAGKELVADIEKRYPGIAVCKHGALNATACPGKNFPFDEIVYGKTDEPTNTDAEGGGASDWAAKSCQKAIDKGIFKGDGAGNYNWQEPLTREAFCAVMDRMGLL